MERDGAVGVGTVRERARQRYDGIEDGRAQLRRDGRLECSLANVGRVRQVDER